MRGLLEREIRFEEEARHYRAREEELVEEVRRLSLISARREGYGQVRTRGGRRPAGVPRGGASTSGYHRGESSVGGFRVEPRGRPVRRAGSGRAHRAFG